MYNITVICICLMIYVYIYIYENIFAYTCKLDNCKYIFIKIIFNVYTLTIHFYLLTNFMEIYINFYLIPNGRKRRGPRIIYFL